MYKATSTVKVSKGEKGEVSGKVEGVDVKASGSVKIDLATKKATMAGEVSAGVSVGKKALASGSVSVDTNGQTGNVRMGLKVDTQLSDKRKVSAGTGIGFSF